MSKLFKRILTCLFIALCGLVLVGCEMGGGNGGNGGNGGSGSQNGPTVAKLDANKQGTYYGDDVVVVVSESKVSVTDPTGKTLEYVLYVEGDKYYIEEEGRKVYCTFGDGTVTNEKGTFTKNSGGNGGGQTGNDTPANIDASLRGEYWAGPLKIVVEASRVTVTQPNGQSMSYNLYQENGRIYFYDEGQKIYCTFGDGTVTNIYGTFTRDGGGMTSVSASEAAGKYAQFLGMTVGFRIPDGTAVSDSTDTQTDSVTYAVMVVNPNESYEEYLRYFNSVFEGLGYSQANGVWLKSEGSDTLGASIAFDTKTNSLAVVATKIKDTGPVSTDMEAKDFVALFKAKTGVELRLPSTISTFSDVSYYDDAGLINGYFKLDGVAEAGELQFDELAGILDGSIAPKGYEKGVPSTQKYADTQVYSVQWTKANDYTFITLELTVGATGYKFMIGALYDLDNQQGTAEWPKEQIAQIFENKVTIPDFAGSFDSARSVSSTDEGGMILEVSLTNVSEADFNTYIQSLKRAGFDTQDVNWYVDYLENNYIAHVTAAWANGGAFFTFKLRVREINPWPTSLIQEKLGDSAANVLPKPDSDDNYSYSSQWAYGSLHISVDAGTQTDIIGAYEAKLLKAGFVRKSNAFVYTFENNDVLEVIMYNSTGYTNKFQLDISYEEYVGLEYNLPENFSASILGFQLVKIGESYVYLYTYQGTTMVETYLYDAQLKQWMYASGQALKQYVPGYDHVIWMNLGTEDAPAYYQYVDRPQVDDFLRGNKGLAYSFYEDMLDASNATKDPSKDETIAGVSCEYVTFGTKQAVAGTVAYTATYELWIEPSTKMIYRVKTSLNYAGTTQNTTPFEINSIDKTVTSFKQAGISGCILPTYNKETATDDDHLFGEVITVNATCGKDGEKYQVCSACGEKKVIETTKATGQHNPYLDNNGQPVWTGDYEGHHSHYCQDCQKYYDEQDCQYSEWEIDYPATCKNTGTKHRKCSICGDTQRETIPSDPDAHLYLNAYNQGDVTIVLPTKEAAGSITFKCKENCGATEVITLPVLNETNYRVIVFKDYDDNFEEKNYQLYVLDVTGLMKEMTSKLHPTKELTAYNVTDLFSYGQISWQDFENVVCGFKGDEVADQVASVPKNMQGEYYNDENVKAILGESIVTVYDTPYTLYLDNDKIYFKMNGNKYYCTINNNGTISVDDMGTFAKLTPASIPENVCGEYYNEDNMKAVLGSDYVEVYGEEMAKYNLFTNNDGIFFILDSERVFCTLNDDGSIDVDGMGTFAKRVKAKLAAKLQGEYYDEDSDIRVFVAESTVKVQTPEGVSTYDLYERDEVIFFVDDYDEIIECEFDADEGTIYNAYGFFTKVGQGGEDEGEEGGEEDNTVFPLDEVQEILGFNVVYVTYTDATYSYEEFEEDEASGVMVYVTLPEETDPEAAYASMISYLEEYDETLGYVDPQGNYQLYVYVEGDGVVLAYIALQ